MSLKLLALPFVALLLQIQEGSGPDIPFHEYDPPSTLVVPETIVRSAKFPFIDVHNHQFAMAGGDLGPIVAEMDKLNMAVLVNLSGRSFNRVTHEDGTVQFKLGDPEVLVKAIENARQNAPGRFIVFTNVSFDEVEEPGWSRRAVAQLEADVAAGAKGLKIYKSLGMTGFGRQMEERLRVDDPRLDPIWEKCGELGIPVLIHTADPAPFWQPRDGQNERLYELMERPDRYRDPATNPSWEELIAEQHAVFRKHPDTIFINAHLGWMGNDLARLGRLLDELPNVYTEIGAVLAELGRQPHFARKWLIEYQDRVLFGKDAWTPEEYWVYFRVLETDDDYIQYYRRRHAFWRIYGLALPDEVLAKIYYGNAMRIIPGIDETLFPESPGGER